MDASRSRRKEDRLARRARGTAGRFAPQGFEAVGGPAEAFAKLYREDYEKYGRLVRELGITID
jgi:hypothetical protein